MRNTFRKVITLSLALLLCLLPLAVHAESLLGDRLARAFENGRRVEAALRIDLDDTLGEMMIMPQETLGAVQSLLQNTVIKVFAVNSGSDIPEFGFELTIQDIPIVNGSMWPESDKLAVVTNLLPGKTLLINSEELMSSLSLTTQEVTAQAEDLQNIGVQLERYLIIITEWLDSAEGILTENAQSSPSTQQRNAVDSSVTLRITSNQLKELLVKLASELSQDDALMQMLSSYVTLSDSTASVGSIGDFLSEAQALVTNTNTMQLTILTDAQEEVAGIEGVIPNMFGDHVTETSFTYDHLTDSGKQRNGFIASLADEETGLTSIDFEQISNEAIPEAPNGSMALRVHQQSNSDLSTVDFLINHTYARALATDHETITGQTEVSFSSTSGISPSENSEDLMNSMIASMQDFAFAIGADFTSDTRVQGDLDFTSDSTLELNMMGMKLGRILVSLSSSVSTATDTSSNTIVDMENLSDSEMIALEEELNNGVMMALMGAMSVLPPELLQMMQ